MSELSRQKRFSPSLPHHTPTVIGLARPLHDAFQQRQAAVAQSAVGGFVIEVPYEDAVVLTEAGHDLLDIGFEQRMRALVDDHRMTGRGRPRPCVPAFERFGLRPGHGIGVGAENAVVEEDRHCLDTVSVANFQKFVERFDEMFRILGIDGVLKHDAGAVQPRLFSQCEFALHHFGRETRLVPHGRIVDSICGNVVEAAEPRIGFAPCLRLRFGPAFRSLCVGRANRQDYQ